MLSYKHICLTASFYGKCSRHPFTSFDPFRSTQAAAVPFLPTTSRAHRPTHPHTHTAQTNKLPNANTRVQQKTGGKHIFCNHYAQSGSRQERLESRHSHTPADIRMNTYTAIHACTRACIKRQNSHLEYIAIVPKGHATTTVFSLRLRPLSCHRLRLPPLHRPCPTIPCAFFRS